MSRALALLIVAASLAGALPARAAGDDIATAQVLFDEGRRRMSQHDYAGACPKLEESQRLSPAVGTEFNLADCWEHVDKLASAWAAFLDVADQTHRRGEAERERAARDRAGMLEPRLAHVTLDVPTTHRIPSLEVLRDGQLVRDALWGVGVPVDAGDHQVEARAQGRRAWTTVVRATDGQTSTVSVPELPVDPTALKTLTPPDHPTSPPSAPPRPLPPPPPVEASADHTAALVVLIGSVVLGGVGVLGVVEHDQTVRTYNNDGTCPGINSSVQPGRCGTLVSSANTWMTVGEVSFVASGITLVGGVVLWFTAPHVTAKAGVACRPGPGFITCSGSF